MSQASDLGAVVVRQKPSYVPAIVLLAVGILLLLLGALIGLGAGSAVFLASLGTPGILCLLAGAFLIQRKRNYSVVLHEKGLEEIRGGLQRVLHYKQVEELSFRSTRVMLNGVYVGTVEELSLQSADFGRAPLKFRNEYKEKAGAPVVTIAGLADRIAVDLAARANEQLRRGGRLSCGGRVTVTEQGLEFPSQTPVPWNKITRHELNQGKFRLWLDNASKPALEVSTGVANFLPFHKLLLERVPGR